MSKFKLSPVARDALMSAGWHEGRLVSIEDIKSLLRSKGISMNKHAESFLRTFRGISLSLPDGGLTSAAFDVVEQLTYLEDGHFDHFQGIFGKPLCLVGYGGRFLFFLADTGEFVFLQDEWLCYLVAADIHDAFELICDRYFDRYLYFEFTQSQLPE